MTGLIQKVNLRLSIRIVMMSMVNLQETIMGLMDRQAMTTMGKVQMERAVRVGIHQLTLHPETMIQTQIQTLPQSQTILKKMI